MMLKFYLSVLLNFFFDLYTHQEKIPKDLKTWEQSQERTRDWEANFKNLIQIIQKSRSRNTDKTKHMSKSQWVNTGKVFCLPCWFPIHLLLYLEQLIILVNDTKIMVHLAHVLIALKVTLISSWKVCVRVVLWPPDVKRWFIGKYPDVGKMESRRKRRWQRIRWLNGITNSMDMSVSKQREIVKDRETWPAAVHGVTKSQTWLSDWTTASCKDVCIFWQSILLPLKVYLKEITKCPPKFYT